MRLKALISTLVFMGSVMLTTAQIQAATITDTDSFAGLLTELADQPLRVDLFNGALGTLTKVIVTLEGSLTSQGTVTNTAAQAQSFTVSTRAQLFEGTKSGSSPAVLPGTFAIFTPFDLIGSQTYSGLAPNTPTAFGAFSAPKGPLTVLDTTANLAQFIGAGVFGYDFDTLILTSVQGGGGNVTNAITTTANATLTVTYEYEGDVAVVPEPTTVSLVGLGLIGLAYARRRQSRKA